MDIGCPFNDEQCIQALHESIERINELFVPGAVEWAKKAQLHLHSRLTTSNNNIQEAFASRDAPKLYKNIYIHEQSYKKIFEFYKCKHPIQKKAEPKSYAPFESS